MYKSIDTLNSYDKTIAETSTIRWLTPVGLQHQKKIIDKIEADNLNALLDAEVQQGNLNGFLENEWDLKGISIFRRNLKSSGSEVLKSIDFSYAFFSYVTFEGFVFAITSFDFVRFSHCKFINCEFRFTRFYGCTFNDCDIVSCDFLENSKFDNCNFMICRILYNYSKDSQFLDCKFDSNIVINNQRFMSKNIHFDTKYENKSLADYYSSISEAFEAGKVMEKRREYLYKSKSAYSKYNTTGFKKINQLIIKWISNYGLKPSRPILLSVAIILLFTIIFSFQDCCYINPLQTSISAFLTIGDTDSLQDCLKWCFLIEGFLGVFSLGLFLATLLNVWFSEK